MERGALEWHEREWNRIKRMRGKGMEWIEMVVGIEFSMEVRKKKQ